jgi:putative SOS response-associated peptidase YedK
MPAVLRQQDEARWLDSKSAEKGLLVPFDSEALTILAA